MLIVTVASILLQDEVPPFHIIPPLEAVMMCSQEAINDFTAALELDPRDASALIWRGHAYRMLGNFKVGNIL